LPSKSVNAKKARVSPWPADGKKVSAGEVVELDNDTANTLMSYGKAEASDGKVSEKKDRSVGLEKSEVKVKRRKEK